jgi:hypothetical protein
MITIFTICIRYIVAVSFIGGGNRRKPPTYCKSLTNCITKCCIEYIPPWARFELTTLMTIGTGSVNPPTIIRVITKLPNSEQSYKGKFKIIKYINRQNQSTTGKMWKRNDPNLVQAFLKKWWVESDFKASNLPLSLRFKASGCYYNSIYNNTWTKQVKQLSKQHQAQWRHFYVTHW